MKNFLLIFSTIALLFVLSSCSESETTKTNLPVESYDLVETTKSTETSMIYTSTEEVVTQTQEDFDITQSTSTTFFTPDDLTQGDITMKQNWLLTVNGNEISSKYVKCHYNEQYVELPLIAIVEALGAEIVYQDNAMFEFVLAEKTFTLNKQQLSLKEKGNDLNLIAKLPGTTHTACRQIYDDEFIVDNDTLSYFFYLVGVIATVDYDISTVSIDNR